LEAGTNVWLEGSYVFFLKSYFFYETLTSALKEFIKGIKTEILYCKYYFLNFKIVGYTIFKLYRFSNKNP